MPEGSFFGVAICITPILKMGIKIHLYGARIFVIQYTCLGCIDHKLRLVQEIYVKPFGVGTPGGFAIFVEKITIKCYI